MRKIAFVKACSIMVVLLISINFSNAQQRNIAKYTFSSEVIPYLYFPEEGAGDGFQVGLARSLGSKYKLQLTYGSNKYTYKLSGDYIITVGGVPLFIKKADENIFTPKNERVEGIPDESLYEMLENTGIKHFKPDDGAFTVNYINLEILRTHQIGSKWKIDWGLGGQFGLMNRNELAGAVVSELHYPLSGNNVTTNVTFRISAKYLYYGFTSRIAFTRKITDHFSVGGAGGIHMMMSKRSVDMIKPYLSAVAYFSLN